MATPLFLGCAGWSLFKTWDAEFSATGTHLERYASRFNAVEINSSFYRPHQPKTYAKWAASVPEEFSFSVKVPKEITHTLRLKNAEAPLERFLGECASLGEKLGPLLVQLPPSLAFNEAVANDFFALLRERFAGGLVCEPRHLTWFTPEAEELLIRHRVARVAADPALTPQAARPGGWNGLLYYRLHGSPRIYYSAYSPEFLQSLAEALRVSLDHHIPTWCIFDNTAEGAATGDALSVLSRLS
jgi:uncharacterized protein YecE (DUF72 family)